MTVNELTSLNKALSLISQAPFKTSLPLHFSSDENYNDLNLSLNHVSQAEQFSDIMLFQRSKATDDKSYIEDFHTAISTKVINNKDAVIGDELHAELREDITSAHLKIKFLCEFALSQVSRDAHLLTFEELLFIKRQLKQQGEIKEEIESQIQGNAKLVNNILTKEGKINEDDLMMLRGLTATNEQLLIKLVEVSKDIHRKEKVVENQHLLALRISYFEDLEFNDGIGPSAAKERLFNGSTINDVNNNEVGNVTTDVQTEQLLSYIVSLVVQRNIPLPVPDDQVADSQSQWAKDCIDALLNSLESSSTTKRMSLISPGDSKDISKLEEDYRDLKTAMSDLQFAHQFLTRQFEEERTLNNQIIQTHIKKQKSLENKLSENIIILEKSTQKSILIEHEKNILESQLSDRLKEIQSIQRQLADLKLSTLGISSSTTSSSSPYSASTTRDQIESPEQSNLTSFNTSSNPEYPTNTYVSSPVTGISINLEPSQDLSPNKKSIPLTPTISQTGHGNSNSNHLLSPPSSSSHGGNGGGLLNTVGERTSVSIMRNEFKRMYMDLQNQHEELLKREIDERKRLERLVEKYRSADSDDNFL